MRLAPALALVLLALGSAAAWDCPGGVKGSDSIAGTSPFYGIKEDKPQKYEDHVPAWKKFGPITKVNLYYSYNYGCIQGVKVTYGFDARDAQMLGVQTGLTESHMTLAPYESITRVEVKQQAANKCIDFLKFTTNKGKVMQAGNPSSAGAPQVATSPKAGGFLAAIRGYEDYYADAAVTKGGLQQLQLVWGVAVCPAVVPGPEAPAEPAAPAEAPVRESPEPLEQTVAEVPPPAPTPTEEVMTTPEAPLPEPTQAAEPFCPVDTAKCDASATSGNAACSSVAPFLAPQCVGGCCVSSGKCRKGFCSQAGLGAEVMTGHMLCWGTNGGMLNKFNKCRNMACKLAVPGCISDGISGSCVGTVVALSNDLDDDGKKWVGYPCLQTVPGGLPVNAAGHFDVHGGYANKLWSICNCKANKQQPGYNSTTCKGPMCSLFKRPDLPSLNFGHQNFTLPNIGPLIDIEAFDFSKLYLLSKGKTMPRVVISIPDLRKHLKDIAKDLNTSSEALNPIINALFTQPGYPSWTVSVQHPEFPTIVVNPPKPNFQLNETYPTIDFSGLSSTGAKAVQMAGTAQTVDLSQLFTSVTRHAGKAIVTTSSGSSAAAPAADAAAPAAGAAAPAP